MRVVAFAVDERAVLVFVDLGVVDREILLSAVGKVNVFEAHQAALVLTQALVVAGYVGERVYDQCVDFVELGHTVEQGFFFELLIGHKAYLPCLVVGIPRLVADLLQAGVLAYGHAGHIEDYLLAPAVAEVEVVGVNRESQGGSLVLYDKALEDVAFLVRRNHAALDDEAVVLVVGVVDAVGIVFVVAPEALLEFEDGGVCLDACDGVGRRGGVDIVLAGTHRCRQ